MTSPMTSPDRARLDELRTAGGLLADRLENAAAKLQNNSVAPPAALVDAMRKYAAEFAEFRQSLDPSEHSKRGDSWQSLESALQLRDDQIGATAIIESVLTLRHRTSPDFEPLQAAQELARRLQQELTDSSCESSLLHSLVNGSHGLPALVDLVSSGGELGNSDWEHAQQLVIRDLNRPLAVAAARGHITAELPSTPGSERGESATLSALPLSLLDMELSAGRPESAIATSDSRSETESSADGESHVTVIPHADPVTDASSAPSPDSADAAEDTADGTSLFDDWTIEDSERRQLARHGLSEPPVSTKSPPHAADPVEAVESTPDSQSSSVLDELTTTAPLTAVGSAPDFDTSATATGISDEVRALARQTIQSGGLKREQALSALIWRLIYDGLPGIAWHVSRAGQSVYGRPMSPRADVVRVWTIGSHVRSPHGPLANALSPMIPGHTPITHDETASVSDLAEMRLEQAGLLRATLLAPDSAAGDRLQALAAANNDAQLLDYAATLTRIGAQSAGQSWTSPPSAASGDRAMGRVSLLQHRIGEWLTLLKTSVVPIRRAEPLFSQPHWTLETGGLQRHPKLSHTVTGWLHALHLVHRLLQPVLSDDRDSRAEVRSTAHRIQSKLLVGSRADFPAHIDAIIVPDAAIEICLRRAAEFALQWIDLSKRTDDDNIEDLKTHLDYLQSELWRHQETLLADLQTEAIDAVDLQSQTAIGCLMLAVDHVAELITDRAANQSPEPTVATLLAAPLSCLGLDTTASFNHSDHTNAEFLDRLLRALVNPSTVPRLGLTDRMDIDTHDGPTSVEPSVLDDALQHGDTRRSDLDRELNALAAVLDSAVADGRLSAHDHAGFSARVWSLMQGDAVDRHPSRVHDKLAELQRHLAIRGISPATTPDSARSTGRQASMAHPPPEPNNSILLDDEP